MQHEAAWTARRMIQAILEGRPTDQPAQAAGRWQTIDAALQKVYDFGGREQALDCFERQKRGAPELEALLAVPPRFPATADAVPALPARATAILEFSSPVTCWLDEYIAFASAAAPMTP